MDKDQDIRKNSAGAEEGWSFDKLFADDEPVKESKTPETPEALEIPEVEMPEISAEEEDMPNKQDFSDEKADSLRRLKPEIHLTSVEDDLQEDRQVSFEDDDYGLETSEGEEAYEGSYEEGYEDGEYDEADDDGSYEEEAYGDYEEGEYDESYDGAYDEEYDEGYEDDYDEGYEDGEYGEDDYDAAYAYDYETESDEEDYDYGAARRHHGGRKKNRKPLVIGIGCAIGVILLIILLVMLLKSFGGVKDDESSVFVEPQQTIGVVTQLDRTNNNLVIYNAEAKREISLNVKQKGDNIVSLTGINIGDIIEVQYMAGVQNEVTALQTYNAFRVNNVTGAVPTAVALDLDGTTYTLDNKLVCLYQGQPFDRAGISENTTYDFIAVGNHIYTIYITYATGTLKLENTKAYVNATLILKPATGENDPIEVTIKETMEPIELQEGSVDVEVKKEDKTVYSSRIFISAGKENVLRLPNGDEQLGKVVFSSNIGNDITIRVAGKEYTGGQEIELPYGDYTAVISASGYDSIERSFTVSQPYQQISVEFKENTTLVTISSSMWGASLYVDGAYQGELEGNSISVRLSPGTHTIVCTRTGYYERSETITITEGMADQVMYFTGFVEIESTTPSQPETPPVQEDPKPPVEESSGGTEEPPVEGPGESEDANSEDEAA